MIYRRMILMMTVFVCCFAAFAGAEAGNYRQGLAGTFFKGDDFTRPEDETHFLRSVDNDWGGREGNNWSARWGGFIEGPYSGAVTFTARAVDGIRLLADGQVVIDGLEDSNKRRGRIKRLNWIDVYESKDSGRTWSLLSKVADTDVVNSDFNGNPPSILKLRDGRLCVTYGFKGKPCVMCAKFSGDNGTSWSKPVILRGGARNRDFGYSRSLQRPDGKVVTVYYFATPDNRNQFITATVWDPDKVR